MRLSWNPTLVSGLSDPQLGRCFLAQLVSRTGQIVRLISHDVDQVIGGFTYHHTPGFMLTRYTIRNGGAPATLDVTIPFDDEGPIYANDVKRGGWRGASITIWLMLIDRPATREIIATGFVGPTTFSDRLEGKIALLTRADALKDIVLFTIQPKCKFKLYGTECGVDETFNRLFGSVANVTNRRRFRSTVQPLSGFTFELGKIKFTSGNNAGNSTGASGWIRQWDPATGQFDMVTDFPYDIQVGDLIQASHGCAQNRASCAMFNNKDRYPGFEYVAL
jgi:uncharacterized phage protein (TIGR02218 family)